MKMYPASTILTRASDLGIKIFLKKDGSLGIDAKPGIIKSTILEVIRAHKPLLIEHLSQHILPIESAGNGLTSEERAQYDAWMTKNMQCSICSTCLDSGIETPALDDDYHGLMYCENHHPARLPALQIHFSKINAQGFSDVCSQCGKDASHIGESAIAFCDKCYELIEAPRLAILRRSPGLVMSRDKLVKVAHEIASVILGCEIKGIYHESEIAAMQEAVVAEMQSRKKEQSSDFWESLEAKLEKSGFYEQYRKDNMIDESKFDHFEGGYEGYCKLYQQRQA